MFCLINLNYCVFLISLQVVKCEKIIIVHVFPHKNVERFSLLKQFNIKYKNKLFNRLILLSKHINFEYMIYCTEIEILNIKNRKKCVGKREKQQLIMRGYLLYI